MTNSEIQKLKAKLPRKWTTLISGMTGVSPKTVWRVFNGHSANTAVIDAGILLIQQEQQRSDVVKQIIEQ